ncbi:23S rRNA (uracil-5-)-methyltransferase RumA, partial [Streptococcus suis]
KMVYVSCNASTLARDLAKLTKVYTVDYIQSVDMFPHTARTEAVVKLSKRDINHHIDLEINEEDLKDISVKKDATYSEIKDYVFKK